MRTTIACNRCRYAKVKCHYDGEAPCRACIKSGKTDTCVLTGPVLHKSSSTDVASSASAKRKASGQTPVACEPAAKKSKPTLAAVDDLFASIPTEVLLESMHIFLRHYPELGILHPHDYDELHGGQLTEVDRLRYLAIYAISRRSMKGVAGPAASDIGSAVSRHFKNLSDDPSLGLPLIHIQLLLAICEWGNGQTLKAWMTVGAAGRLCIGALNVTSSSPAVERHTLWACFTLERQLSCGRRRPTMFPSGLTLPLPSDLTATSLHSATSSDAMHPAFVGDMGHGVITEGLMIWSRITSWLVDGGRKQFGMTDPHNCPWKASSVWDGMRVDLHRWRNKQAPLLRYPDTKMSAHAVRRTAETFALVNLVYYIGILNLCREWIPLLPVGEQEPRGPIDLPYLPEPGPREFWLQNRDLLLDAAEQITQIHEDLRRCGVALQTPFTGFCLFGALTCHQYAESFPALAGPAIAPMAPDLARKSVQMLRQFSETWDIGKDWLQIIDKSHIVYKRANANRFRSRRETRYDHVELEEAIISASPEHYAKTSASRKKVSSGAPMSTAREQQHQVQEQQQPANIPTPTTTTITTPGTSNNSSFIGEIGSTDLHPESWGLWLFGDDSQLFPLPGEVDPSSWTYTTADATVEAQQNKEIT